ncbi:O-antigen ligase family protein [Candidatus Dependentiae bacterium]|nr:O-antigen ligase family protein [Candidatus Dependentiae bacterium]
MLLFSAVIVGIVYYGNEIEKTQYGEYYLYILALFATIMVIISPEKGLCIFIIVSMFSPEISFGRVGRRNIAVRFDDVMVVICVIIWFVSRFIKKDAKFFVSTPLDKPIFVFILVCALSSARGVLIRQVDNPKEAFFYVLKLLEYFFVYYLVVNTVKSKHEVRRYITVFIIVLAFTCIDGLRQMEVGVSRVSTPFEDTPEPNTLGGYLLFMIGLVGAMAIMGVKIWNKLFLWILFPLVVWVFLHTLSRGSYLGYFPVLITLTFLLPSQKRIFGLLILIVSILLISYLPEGIKSRIERTFQGPNEYRIPIIAGEEKTVRLDSSSGSRITKYESILNYWAEYPIFGLGITGAGFVDSSIFRTIGELGLFGILSLVWLFYTILSETFNAYKHSRNSLNKSICIGYICGLIGLLVHATTANTFFLIRIMGPFWFLTGIIFMIPPLYFDEIAKPHGVNLLASVEKENNLK